MLMTAFEIVESDLVDSINKEMTDELEIDDLERITKAKDKTELLKVCGSLKKKYKYFVGFTEENYPSIKVNPFIIYMLLIRMR